MKNILSVLSFLVSLVIFGCSSDDGMKNLLPTDLNFTGNILSCGDFSVSQFLNNEDSNISLEITGNGREELQLTSEITTFSLPSFGLNAVIFIWDGPAGANFCNDVIQVGPNLISFWTAVSGNLKISVSNIEETDIETFYTITIILEDVVFENNDSTEKRIIPNLVIKDAPAGWFPG